MRTAFPLQVVPFLTTILALPTSAAAAGFPTDTSEAIHGLLRVATSEARLPSLSVAVARDGEIVYTEAVGLVDLENAVPATVRSVYPIGSVSKPVTAVAALRLAERGRIDLDAPVQTYCETFPMKDHPVTLRDLLAHLGGIRGYDYSRFEEDFLNRRVYPSLEAALEKFAADPLVGPPRSKYQYSSWGYVLVGCALEGASGSPYSEVLRREILDPVGMTRTTLDDPEAIIPYRVQGYGTDDGGAWRPAGAFNPSDRYPAGGLASTPTDLVRFGSALLAGELLASESREAMWKLQRTTAGEPTGAGLGWDLSPDGREISHGGSTVGGTAYLYLRPSDRVAVAFATNLSLWTEGRHELARAIADALTGS